MASFRINSIQAAKTIKLFASDFFLLYSASFWYLRCKFFPVGLLKSSLLYDGGVDQSTRRA